MCERIDGSDVREQRRRHGHEGMRPGQAESGKNEECRRMRKPCRCKGLAAMPREYAMEIRGAEYKRLIEEEFYPYWRRFRDREYGGILNCISNDGRQLLSERKYAWSQGRWLWILASLYDMARRGSLRLDCGELESWMEETGGFLAKYVISEDGRCCHFLERDGRAVLDTRTGRRDASIYTDCFVLLGMAQDAQVRRREEAVPGVSALYNGIAERIAAGNYLTEPYPVPAGYRAHGIPMILLNVISCYIRMKKSFGMCCEEEIQYGLELTEDIWNSFYDGSYIREFRKNGSGRTRELLEGQVNPGHTLEDLWFQIEFLKEHGELEKYLSRICKAAESTFLLGWDSEFGGLFRFVYRDGGRPKGAVREQGQPAETVTAGSGGHGGKRQEGGAEERFGETKAGKKRGQTEKGEACQDATEETEVSEPEQEACAEYEKMVLGTWDSKLWWPHAEALYLFALLYELTGESRWQALYEKSRDYAFSVFPDRCLGEWVQIRRRDGMPEDRVVALPVKDPFHILRSFIKLVELAERTSGGTYFE